MSDCGTSCGDNVGGPFSEGRELVEFVTGAHDGSVARSEIPNGGLDAKCHGCGEAFHMGTFVDKCPKCGGVHAVSPPRCGDPTNIQFAGTDYKAP